MESGLPCRCWRHRSRALSADRGNRLVFTRLPTSFLCGGTRSRILWQWLLTSLLLALLAFLFRIGIQFSRGSIICFAALGLVSLFASRSLMKAALDLAVRQRTRARSPRGAGRTARRVSERRQIRPAAPVRIDGSRARRFSESWELVACGEQGYLGVVWTDALVVARDHGAEEIVLALCWNDIRGIELSPRQAARLAASRQALA